MSPILARSGRLAAILLPVVAMVVWTSSGEARVERRFPAAVTAEGVALWSVEPRDPVSRNPHATGLLHPPPGLEIPLEEAFGIGVRGLASGVQLSKTVGVDPAVCATTSVIEVPSPFRVTYCYKVENVGFTSLFVHDLVDDKLGPILTNFPFELMPGAVAFVTQSAVIDTQTLNVASWTADGVSDLDAARVDIGPGILLHKTVGLDPSTCASTTVVDVPPGTEVTYCYEVTNASGVVFGTHDLVDDKLGPILTNLPFELAPGASAFLTLAATISTETVNVATWTADTVEASAVATVVHGTLIFADGFESGNVSAW